MNNVIHFNDLLLFDPEVAEDDISTDSPIAPSMAPGYRVAVYVSLSDFGLETEDRRLGRVRCVCRYSCP